MSRAASRAGSHATVRAVGGHGVPLEISRASQSTPSEIDIIRALEKVGAAIAAAEPKPKARSIRDPSLTPTDKGKECIHNDADVKFVQQMETWLHFYKTYGPPFAGPVPIPPTGDDAFVASRPTSPPSSSMRPPVRLGKSIVAKPESFDGNKARYTQWMRMINLYIQGFDEEPSDRQKIIIALSYMKGDNAAGRAADLYFTQGYHETESFQVFTEYLDRMFKPANLSRRARLVLRTCTQTSKETVHDPFLS